MLSPLPASPVITASEHPGQPCTGPGLRRFGKSLTLAAQLIDHWQATEARHTCDRPGAPAAVRAGRGTPRHCD